VSIKLQYRINQYDVIFSSAVALVSLMLQLGQRNLATNKKQRAGVENERVCFPS
jgi:hypothetical protein